MMVEETGTFEMIVHTVEPGSCHAIPFGGDRIDCPVITASLQPLDYAAPEVVNPVLFALMGKRVKVTFEVME